MSFSSKGEISTLFQIVQWSQHLKLSKANLYADDTEVSFSSSNPSDVIQNFQADLPNISEWMRINKLSIHPEKTVFMVINHPRILQQKRLVEGSAR